MSSFQAGSQTMYAGYIRPTSLGEALSLLGEKGVSTRVISGGTDLMVRMRKGELRPDRLLSVTRIKELSFIHKENGKILLGPALTFSSIQDSILLAEEVPFLVEAASQVGSPQIRAVGTVGGNIVNAAPCADLLPVLVAMNAEARLLSKSGERRLPVSELVLGPHKTALREDELLAEFSFNLLSWHTGTSFVKLGRRAVMARARASVACAVSLSEDEVVNEVRIALGAVTPRCERFVESERVILGKKLSESVIKNASAEAVNEMVKRCGMRWSTEYKMPVVGTLVERAIKIASSRARERSS